MKRQTKLALIGAGTAVVVLLGGVGIASATGSDSVGTNPLSRLLASLVGKGTITQSQADAIVTAAEEMRTQDHAARDAHRVAEQKMITDTLGLDWATIQSRMSKGETLGQIAGDKKSALIDALVAFDTKQIDADVASGRLTSEQATQMKANLKDRITAMLDRSGPDFGRMGGRGMGMHDDGFDHHGHGMGMGFGPDEMGNQWPSSSSVNG